MALLLLKAVGMAILLIGLLGMLIRERSKRLRTTFLLELTEYWGYGYVGLYVTNWWPSAASLSLTELLATFVVLPFAYGATFWIAEMVVKEGFQKSFW